MKPSARKIAAATPNAVATINARTELYSVPQISGKTEYTFLAGSQTCPVRKPTPYCLTAGAAALTILNTMKIETSMAIHVKPAHKARNAVFAVAWMRDGGLAIGASVSKIDPILFRAKGCGA